MSQKQSLKAISRIYKDLQEFEENPLEGLAICMPNENDPFTLRSNIRLLGGIYEGIQLHTEIKLSPQYPLTAPKMSILKGQPFDHDFHHHIYARGEDYTVCIDLLDHGFFAKEARTGWIPEYTLSTMLVQMQSFFAFNHESHPSKEKLEILKETLKNYHCEIKLTDGSIKMHRFDDPYPPFNSMKQSNQSKESKEKELQFERFKCHFLKTSPNDKELLFGLPIYSVDTNYGEKCKRKINPIFEILSYDAYLLVKKEGPKKFTRITSHDSDQSFNAWLPLFFHESTYQKFKSVYLRSFSFIFDREKTPINDKKILKIFKKLFVNTINSLSEKNLPQKIELFCLLMRLFLRIMEEYPNIEILMNEKFSKKIVENNINVSERKIIEFFCFLPFTKFRKDLPFLFIEIFKKKLKTFIIKDCDEKNFPDSTIVDQIFTSQRSFYLKLINSFLFSEIIMKTKTEFIKMLDENIGLFNQSPFFLSLKRILNKNQKISNFSEIFQYMECITPSLDNSIILSLVYEVYENVSKNSSFWYGDNKDLMNLSSEEIDLEQFYIGNLFSNNAN